jgi:hypothetical protein
MQPLPNSSRKKLQTKQSKATQINLLLPALFLVAALGVGLVAHPKQATKGQQAVSPSATTVTIENNEQESKFQVFWGVPASQVQFWLDNSPTPAQCDQQHCIVPKLQSTKQIYFRWLDTSNNQWYYFQCDANYKGQFQGIPYSAK